MPQTMLQVKLNAHSGSSSAMEFEIVYRVTVGLIAWLTLSSIPMSGNGIEKSIALWKMKRMLLTNSFQGISP